MRKKIVAGNWKMNCLKADAVNLVQEIIQAFKIENPTADAVVIAPPFPFIAILAELVALNPKISIAAQNCSDKTSGAFTGEVAAAMIKSVGATHVIIGHSERRTYYLETDELISAKVKAVLANGMIPIFCCGESLSQRKSGSYKDVVNKQLESGLFNLSKEEFENIFIAYEPVWAIGTGETATPAQAQEMHAFIRSMIEKKYGLAAANNTTILYGGSCNEKNANELFALPDVDGGLIGGASLKADSFSKIANSFTK